ncbi:TIGR03862 family flavoprotein [Roseobacter sp. HKCCA0434]|uniref:TIGR03862 family flavoprotein n=1 Tax=Roseobacter sp. HKCCA0434 TaxID=3079297 RepID=UPI002905C518|nr:TIGR03862 family flavoprotein [Roseobacter sp. HKCCA0434]
MVDVLVIGGGPAGLAAAEVASAAGASVLVAEQKPSVGRKFLMAGKSGLNLTKAEAVGRLIDACGADWLAPMLRAFDAEAAQNWAGGLGQPVFTGSSGRVFPTSMKGSPLLRAWLARLEAQDVEIRTRWRWLGSEAGEQVFETPEDTVRLAARAVVLACGGASWARLGSDGRWTEPVGSLGAEIAPFAPANMGFDCDWSDPMARWFGAPVKDVGLIVGERLWHGEFVISRHGVEGSLIYAASACLRDRGEERVHLDLAPKRSVEALADALARPRGKASISNHLRKAAGITGVKAALLREAGPLPDGASALAARIKSCPLALQGPRPLDEAISVAGGIRAEALDEQLMLRACPGLFAAGEMLDWEAPTGGYLLTASMATGRWAGAAAAQWAARGGRAS